MKDGNMLSGIESHNKCFGENSKPGGFSSEMNKIGIALQEGTEYSRTVRKDVD